VQGPGEEEDLGGRAFAFGGADDGRYGFEVILELDISLSEG
jgi:hypothetical protein